MDLTNHRPMATTTAQLRRIALAMVLFASPVVAQETQPEKPIDKATEKPAERIMSGQVRLRSELDDRGVLADESVFVHLLRSRLRATVRPVSTITILAELQDSRYWGQSDPTLGRGTTDADADLLDMHQAWASIDSILGTPLRLRVGRQEMSFANERLIGVSNWNNTGRSFDAARLTWQGEELDVDLFASRLSAPTAGPIASQNFYGLWGSWSPSESLRLDLFGLRDDNTMSIRSGADSGRALLERYTAGAYARIAAEPIDAELEGAIQTGNGASSDSSNRRSIDAFMVSATVGVTLLPESKTRIYALATVLSGDGDRSDDRTETFNTLFGTNHRVYGNLDIVPEVLGAPEGLVDLSGGVTSTPTKGLRFQLEGHLLRLQRPGAGRPTIGDTYGSEIDLNAWWRSSSSFELSGGGGMFMPGLLTETRLGGADARFWGYVSGQFDF
jgi:hypothetical protein